MKETYCQINVSNFSFCFSAFHSCCHDPYFIQAATARFENCWKFCCFYITWILEMTKQNSLMRIILPPIRIVIFSFQFASQKSTTYNFMSLLYWPRNWEYIFLTWCNFSIKPKLGNLQHFETLKKLFKLFKSTIFFLSTMNIEREAQLSFLECIP